jgi:tetratricopeptide (TPR) repeat protein
LAYAEQGRPVEQSAAQLERAVELNPDHVRTRNDLSHLYARAGRFEEQLAVLGKALARSPGDDDLTEAVFTVKLLNGRYDEAERLIATHRFAPRHRSYGLRDKYRLMRYGMGARLFAKREFAGALEMFDSALQPPESLGTDDFESQALPVQQYFRGRALEGLGRPEDARKAYERAIQGMAQLSGDRDSWSPENFYMALALDKLGRKDEAAALEKRFEDFAAGEVNARNAQYRATAQYLLALIRKHQGRDRESAELLNGSLQAAPDYLPARLQSRGELL